MTTLTDYHGTPVEVDLIYKSTGVFVYLTVGEDFARLTLQQAIQLADELRDTAESHD